MITGFCAALRVAGMNSAEVAPVPPPPSAGPVVLLTDRALVGALGTLYGVRIGIADGRIASLAAARGAAVVDLRG
jgi:hypothetical protein